MDKQLTVGLTFDLKEDYLNDGMLPEEVAEFDSVETIDSIESTLRSLGFATERIGGVKRLVSEIAAGKRWDIVFNFAEGVNGISRESQVPALLDAYHIPFVFSDAVMLGVCLHKGLAKRIIMSHGLPTPGFAIVNTCEEAGAINLPYPLFAKPIAGGTGVGVNPQSRVENLEMLCCKVREITEKLRQPVIVERYLPGREFTVGIVGSGKDARIAGVMEILLKEHAEKGVYSFVNKARYEELVEYRKGVDEISERAGKLGLAAYRALECLDAGRVDIRLDENGKPSFIEINPLAGLHPVHSDLPMVARMHGITYEKLLSDIMDSALRRAGLKR